MTVGLYNRKRSVKGPNGENIQVPKGTSYSRTNYEKNHDPVKKDGSTGSRTRPRNQIVPEVKEGILGSPRKGGPKHPQRKDISLPPTVLEAAQQHADALGMSDVDYYNAAIVSFFSAVLTGEVQLITPAEACPACGAKGNKYTRPNAPDVSGFKRHRVGVRFTENVAKMMLQLADDWYGGTWSHPFQAAVRRYLGDRNPPPEGKGQLPGVKLPEGGRGVVRGPRKGGRRPTAEERVVAELAAGKP